VSIQLSTMMKVSSIGFVLLLASATKAFAPLPTTAAAPAAVTVTGPHGTKLFMGVSSTVKRIRDSVLNKERSREDLKVGIAGFYDRSSKLWEDVWGEVCMHSFCVVGSSHCSLFVLCALSETRWRALLPYLRFVYSADPPFTPVLHA
jgi:hypothetical protein